MRLANFIIAGTEKAGTTSVFTYLSEHPGVCSASRKETDFFRNLWSGNSRLDKANYAAYFSRCQNRVPIVMEASPGYLGDAETVVPRMASLIPDVKLLFILRDPVERIYSSFNFHVGRLNIDSSITFAKYVDKCIAYERDGRSAEKLDMDEWYLRVLGFGCYARFLEPYFRVFPRHKLKIMFFENLKADPLCFMFELSQFLELNTNFWRTYQFRRANVTFSVSNERLHKAAMYFNSKSEPFLRRHPALKHYLVSLYKKINRGREGYDPMPPDVHAVLREYYRPCDTALCEMIGAEAALPWLEAMASEPTQELSTP